MAIKEIADTIGMIPKEIVTGVLSAIGAWVVADQTTRRNNKHAERMLELKQSHDEKQADVERQLKMRLDIYIPAIKAASQIPLVLGNQLNPAITDQECMAGLAEIGKEFAAAAGVAGSKSTKSITRLSHKVGEITGKNSAVRMRLQEMHAVFMSAADIVDQQISNGKAVAELMKNANLNRASAEQWKPINQQWEIHEKLMAEVIQKRDASYATYKTAIAEAIKTFSAQVQELFPLQDAALSDLRSDLGLRENAAERAEMREESLTAFQDATAAIIAAGTGATHASPP